MENSRIVAILQMMRDGIQSSLEMGGSGLCSELEYLYWIEKIEEWETTYMEHWLDKHKPNVVQYTEFTKLPCWENKMYWWRPIFQDKDTIKVRVDYLDVLIKELTYEKV
jgi:hypothetical protein